MPGKTGQETTEQRIEHMSRCGGGVTAEAREGSPTNHIRSLLHYMHSVALEKLSRQGTRVGSALRSPWLHCGSWFRVAARSSPSNLNKMMA